MTRTRIARIALLLLALIGAAALASTDIAVVNWLSATLLVAALLAILVWLVWRGFRAFLWRVGRRLAFSYFLIGVLPIPMVAILFLLGAYIHAGFFLGHLYRDGVDDLYHDLQEQAAARLSRFSEGLGFDSGPTENVSFAFYSDGQRVAGDTGAPKVWPGWLEGESSEVHRPRAEGLSHYVVPDEGEPTLAAVVSKGERGVLAVFRGDVEEELSRRSDLRVRLGQAEEQDKDLIRVRIGGREFTIDPAIAEGRELPAANGSGAQADDAPPLWDQWVIWWGELSGPVRSLADGSVVSDYIPASLAATPGTVYVHLFSPDAELDAAAWAGMLSVTGLLANIYGVALIMALFIIFGLSRAVNRLSRATAAVREGDFSARIPVRRRDQVGDLQRTFNQMTENLERAVATAAQKEILEKELEIARDLQQSLLPTDLPRTETIDFATLFEPSAAIGGDYFDILRVGQDRLAVVVADVSGHGLPSGLRMAMLKAALVILVKDGCDAAEILTKLDGLVRSGKETRYFVTTTIAVVDTLRGTMELNNAGHPPTYLLRGGKVDEILLAAPPLGALGGAYARQVVALEPGDIVVWLSDGLIEAADEAGEPFGYERVRAALAGESGSAAEVRDRLLARLAAHTDGHPAPDDKTMVVMSYRLEAGAETARPRAE